MNANPIRTYFSVFDLVGSNKIQYISKSSQHVIYLCRMLIARVINFCVGTSSRPRVDSEVVYDFDQHYFLAVLIFYAL